MLTKSAKKDAGNTNGASKQAGDKKGVIKPSEQFN